MTGRTRNVLLGATGVVGLGMAAGLVAHMTGTSAPPARAYPAEFRYVPADASIVAFVDVRAVLESDLHQRIRREVGADADGRLAFQEQTGIDIDRDIDRFVAAWVPGGPTDGAASRPGPPGEADIASGGIVLLSGRFDDARLERLARARGATVTRYRGRSLVPLPAADAEAQTRGMVMAFVDDETMVVSSDAFVRRALDLRSGRGGVRGNARLMGLLEHVDETSNAWTVGRLDRRAVESMLPEQVGTQMPHVSAFAIGSRINGGVSGTVTAETPDDAAARNLRDLVQGFLALARLQTGSRPELARALDSVRLDATGASVTLSFAVPSDLLLLWLPSLHEPDGSDAD